MLTQRTQTQGTTRPLRQNVARANAATVPLFAADEAWSRANSDRRVAGETDDQEALLEPGFWMTAMVAFLPTVAGCLYLFLTQG
ncbi:hypothetical protein WHZ77_08390 [Bradyrhizobium sp. A5]|uniref:hypothetical protein n=1 Tax=Bradyrhizobium sp. A5 TaxID=3133696 RepID=UPI0032476C77